MSFKNKTAICIGVDNDLINDLDLQCSFERTSKGKIINDLLRSHYNDLPKNDVSDILDEIQQLRNDLKNLLEVR